MKYLDWTITYDNSAKNRVYRLECGTQKCWFGNFCHAILYIREVWEQLHFKVGMKYRTNNTPNGNYNVITRIDEKFVTYAHVFTNGMAPATSCPKKSFLNYLHQPNTGLELIA